MSEISTRIEEISKKIQDVDAEIFRLKRKRHELELQKEKLKERSFAEKSQYLANRNWTDEFPWSGDIGKHLKDTFGLKEFREHQVKAINAILSKHDVILVAPTGGGKSLCYQLPAVTTDGLTLVVSPLLSLMEDQVWQMQKLGVSVELLTSTTEKASLQRILKQLSDPGNELAFKLLYVTPERLAKSKRFMSSLQKCYFAKKLDRIAIDEVHCCSQWGHDFRPDYKFLGSMKTTFPDVPILGVTATATEKVIMDVQKMLNIRDCLVLKAPFNRPNLYYQVMEKPGEKKVLVELLANLLRRRYAGKSGIIYTHSQKDAEDLAQALTLNNCKVNPYHANLSPEVRTKVHENWLSGQIQAVVATVAFGMGIDKPDVRFVIHHTMSRSMENFYQETGRAGRDGKYAECLLLYRFTDAFKITTMMFAEQTGLPNAYSMIQYCISTQCRRDVISQHFAEVWNESDCGRMCDRCRFRKRLTPPKMNISRHIEDLLKIIEQADGMDVKLTAAKLVDAWYQKGPSYLRVPKQEAPYFDRTYAEQIIAYLLLEDYLKEDFHYTAYNTNSYIRKGPRQHSSDMMVEINRARFVDLPEDFPPKDDSDDDIVLISHSPPGKSPPKRPTRRTNTSTRTKRRRKLQKTSRKSSRKMEDSSSTDSDATDDVELVEETPSFFVDLDDSLCN
uniref:ATP-dependent DNA helicase n=1 Tax=Lutzomyia longipalpis TaxID=7200 RepID=A0A1B0CJD7_LUTLO